MKARRLLTATAALLLVLAFSGTASATFGRTETYRVTIWNVSHAQPLSPPVAATHGWHIKMFFPHHLASDELEAIAEDGDQVPMANWLRGLDEVTDVVDVGRPLTPKGTTVNDFTDSVTFEIEGKPWDLFSVATMLICTNDGFTGLPGVPLPWDHELVYWAVGWDAGTEDNTEESEDIVDACSALGPVGLAGDPNGNEDLAVDTDPQAPIRYHRGIKGGGDLDPHEHNWYGTVAKIKIERID